MIPSPLPDTASSLFVRRLHLQAKIGDLAAADWNFRSQTMINEDPQAVQQDEIVLTVFGVGKVYSINLLGFLESYTTLTADVNLAGVAISWAAQINANPDLRGQTEAVANGDNVEITGLIPGDAYDIVAVAETTVNSLQSPVTAAEVPFGRLVLHKGFSASGHRSADQLGRRAESIAFVAQADTLTIIFEAGETYIVEIETDDGYETAFVVPANTSDNQTAADIEAAIDLDLVLVSKGITAGVAANVVTLTSANLGFGFKASVALVVDAGVAVITLVSAYGTGTSLLQAAAGVSEQRYDDEQSIREGDTTVYRPNEPMQVLTDGLIWVELDGTEAAPTFRGDVFVDLNVGPNSGRFHTVTAAGRVLLQGVTWQRGSRNNNADLIGVIKVVL